MAIKTTPSREMKRPRLGGPASHYVASSWGPKTFHNGHPGTDAGAGGRLELEWREGKAWLHGKGQDEGLRLGFWEEDNQKGQQIASPSTHNTLQTLMHA